MNLVYKYYNSIKKQNKIFLYYFIYYYFCNKIRKYDYIYS